jgi:CheY-like chemotaxis protein
VAHAYDGDEIQVLLTDVVMPLMGGRELADQLRAVRPETKVLYASGYAGDAIAHIGQVEAGTELMQKPFTPAVLTRKVREVLDT